jgi:ubiquinone/menaquinone biosynthesis C-methylase UbiE
MSAPYQQMAEYYDLLYTWKDYKKEVLLLKRLIKRYKKSKGTELLDVACGTGKHIQYFKGDFSALATDINQDMLAIARKNVKGITFKAADMVKLDLGKQFDVITCLFSSIGYVKTLRNLKRTLSNFARHLKKGGIVIIEPWFTKSTFKPGNVHMSTCDKDHLKIVRVTTSKVRGKVSILDMHYLIARRKKEVQSFVEHHQIGLFEIKQTINLMKKSGLEAKFLENGLMKDRGLYIGIKK